MRSLLLSAAVAVVCLAAPSAAHAQVTEPFTHRGIFLRLEGGGGYMNSNVSYDSASATVSGGALYGGFALGGAIAENLMLYGEIWGMGAPNPTVSIGSSSTTANNSTLNYGGLGIGIGYFFVSNIFLGVSVDATRLGVTDSNGDDSHSDIGGALTLTLGKQWFISDHLGLGLSLKGIGGGNRDNNNDSSSATYKTFTGLGTVTLTYG